ncbi:MAG: type II secretion system protein, partial [Lachnospiraceae bacterium]
MEKLKKGIIFTTSQMVPTQASKGANDFMKRKHQKGFTLVELIVSFAVLSILLTAAVATVSPASKVFLHTINVG